MLMNLWYMKMKILWDYSVSKKSLILRCGIIVAVFIKSASRFIRGYENRLVLGQTDTAGFLELIDRRTLLHPMEGDFFRSARGLVPLLSNGAEKICSVIPFSNIGDPSFFGIHPYLISVPIAAVSWLLPFSTIQVAALFLGGSVVLGLFAIYRFLRKEAFSSAASAIFVASLCSYPVLFQSLQGQAYFDRLMFGPAVVLLLLLWWSKHRSTSVVKWICVSAIVLSLISERGAALAVLLTIGYGVLLHGSNVFRLRELRPIIITGSLIMVYLYIWMNIWQSYIAYQGLGYRSVLTRLNILFSDQMHEPARVFLLSSVVFLFLSFFSGRGFLVLVVSTAPNILVSIGGAELTGFLTHYHQTYLPVIAGCSCIGILRLNEFFEARIRFNSKKFIPALLSFGVWLFVCLNAVNINYGGVSESFRDDVGNAWLPKDDVLNYQLGEIVKIREVMLYVHSLNPAIVSVQESLMPMSYTSGIDDVEYWPVGVGVADVVIAPYVDGIPNVYPYGDVNGVGSTLAQCVQDVLDKEYKVVANYFGESLRVYLKNG